ncbi:MAG TPA: collagenase [Paucimonas sp.]|nr:collagenase [Paucimonas sp.]
MRFSTKNLLLAALLAVCAASSAQAGSGHSDHDADKPKEAPQPRQRLNVPPSVEELQFNLPPSDRRPDLKDPKRARTAERAQAAAATADCKDMSKMASYSGSALAEYVATLPDYTCTYPLFSVSGTQASTIYASGNWSAVANRFVQEAASYNATNMKLVNLALYLRAGYYLAYGNTIPVPSSSIVTTLRPSIKQLADGNALFQSNAAAYTTAGEVLRLITNMHDEAYYLPSMKNIVVRYTNSSSNPNAAQGLRQSSAAGGFTSALTVLFMAHSRPDGIPLLQNDLSYPTALNNFVVNNKSALLGTETAYQLKDTESEAFRFMKYAALKPSIQPMIRNMLNTTSMTGADNDLWINAAVSVRYYDEANCAYYGTCGFEARLADATLVNSHTCSPTIKIRSQKLTTTQAQQACAIMGAEENFFHDMLLTNRKPVAGDNNAALEVIVFDDANNYRKYAGAIYDIDTDNGGMYLEGNPSAAGNQARFIAYRASWLPDFQIWNLEHEYVHYLDGRFNMAGDFAAGTAKPTVWWIEGIGEYLSKKNNYQEAIDAAKAGTYKLSTIFGNTYSMSDYVARAYRWGYMATRFMVERHRSDVDAVLARFRVGDYAGYQTYMNNIGTRYDTEFANWVQTATTAGEPPLPAVTYPACSSTSQLGKNCSIYNIAASYQAYAYILLPTGAKNLKVFTSGGTGDVDLYMALDRWPTTTSYDAASATAGNRETISMPSPATGRWYYIVLKARQPFSGVTLSATYD